MHGDEDDVRIETLADTITARITRRIAAREATSVQQARLTLTIVSLGTLFALAIVTASTLVVRREVLERQRAYDKVDEAQNRLTQILDNTPVGVYVIDQDGTTAYANRAAQAILGRGVKPSDLYAVEYSTA